MEIDSNTCNVGEKWAPGHMQKRSPSSQIVCTFCQMNIANWHIWFYHHISRIEICVIDADMSFMYFQAPEFLFGSPQTFWRCAPVVQMLMLAFILKHSRAQSIHRRASKHQWNMQWFCQQQHPQLNHTNHRDPTGTAESIFFAQFFLNFTFVLVPVLAHLY